MSNRTRFALAAIVIAPLLLVGVEVLIARNQEFQPRKEWLTLVAQSQPDNDWSYIGTSKEGLKLYYSPDRTVQHGKPIQAWFKSLHPETDKEISYALALDEFNCRKGTYRGLQGTLYHRDGRAVTVNKASQWEYPLPSSVAEMKFKQMCRLTRGKPIRP